VTSVIVNDTGFLYTIPQQNLASGPVQLQSPTPIPSDVAGIAERFVQARLAASALEEYPGAVPPDLETAYRCQDHALAQWPDAVAGWKVARVPPPQQAKYAEERLVGPVFAPNVRVAEPGRIVDCPVFEGGFAAVEAEIVLCVGRDAPPDKFEWTLDEAADFVGELCIGIEIASSPLATLNDLVPNNDDVVGGMVRCAAALAKQHGYSERGYRTVLNCNRDAGQTVFHIHLHLLAGRGLAWPPG
jgi:2-keto-4-pentenoate hydratase